MPLDYLNEASDEIQRLFARLDGYCSQKCVWRRINKKVYRFFRFV